jgi:SEC-C motif
MSKPALTKPRVGRNNACPCGSGSKYKRCCMHVRPASPVEMPADSHAQSETRVRDHPLAMRDANEDAEAIGRPTYVGLADATPPRPALAEAESSLLVHLELYSWLGNEAAMAIAYGCLGRLYEELGDLEAAEAMHDEGSRLQVAPRHQT